MRSVFLNVFVFVNQLSFEEEQALNELSERSKSK